MSTIKKITVLGDGSWGTTIALMLHKKGFEVRLWGAFADYVSQVKAARESDRFLPGIKIPEDILVTSDIGEALGGSSIIILAIPSQYLRETLKKINKDKLILRDKLYVSVVKGLEDGTFKRPSEIIKDEIGSENIVVLSGPTIAKEVADGLPTSAVAASGNKDNAKLVQDIFISDLFRVYTSDDVVGVELGGAFKNIIAIAAGISDGLGFGANAKAALFTRGLVEIKRMGVALGAKQETFDGLSGTGDLLTTCVSKQSRNRFVGEEIAKGSKLSEVLDKMTMVAEGIETSKSVYNLITKMGIDAPITTEVYRVLFENKDPLSAVGELMTRTRRTETE
ncbi:MAG: NAD(P)H-dependent glycerol-3-phosphate dehydrogenase [Candidatus Omnitrophota bacterium]